MDSTHFTTQMAGEGDVSMATTAWLAVSGANTSHTLDTTNSMGQTKMSVHEALMANLYHFIQGASATPLNALVLVLFIRAKKISDCPSDVFLKSQLCVDLVQSLILFIVPISEVFKPSFSSDDIGSMLLCNLVYSHALFWQLNTMSTLNNVLLTVERYLKIVFPLQYQTRMTSQTAKKIVLVMVLVILWGPVLNVIFYGIRDGQCMHLNSAAMAVTIVYLAFLTTCIPVFVFGYCYCHMLVVLHRSRKKFIRNRKLASDASSIRNHLARGKSVEIASISHVEVDLVPTKPAPVEQPRVEGGGETFRFFESVAERRLLRLAVLTCLTYFGCNGPLWVYGIATQIYPSIDNKTGWKIITILTSSKYTINPILYILSLKKLSSQLQDCCSQNEKA